MSGSQTAAGHFHANCSRPGGGTAAAGSFNPSPGEWAPKHDGLAAALDTQTMIGLLPGDTVTGPATERATRRAPLPSERRDGARYRASDATVSSAADGSGDRGQPGCAQLHSKANADGDYENNISG